MATQASPAGYSGTPQARKLGLKAGHRLSLEHLSEITDNLVRREALALGVVDVKVAAIDNDWSGQRVVWRLSNRTTP